MMQLQLKRPKPRFSLFLSDLEAEILEQLLIGALREADDYARPLIQGLLEKVQPHRLIPLNDLEIQLVKRLLRMLKSGSMFLILKEGKPESRRWWRRLHRLCEGLLEQLRWVQRPPGRLPNFSYEQLSLGEFIPGIPERPRIRWRPPKPEKDDALRMTLDRLSQVIAEWIAGFEIEGEGGGG